MSDQHSYQSFFFPSLNTHRIPADGTGTFFLHEAAIALVSAFFCRFTVKSHEHESIQVRLCFSCFSGILAYSRKPYDIQLSFLVFSFIAPKLIYMNQNFKKNERDTVNPATQQLSQYNYKFFVKVSASAMLPLLFCWIFSSFSLLQFIPSPLTNILSYLFPISDLMDAYNITLKFTKKDELNSQLAHLLFVTFNIQIGMGYLGIDFLRAEQKRRNQLVRLEIISENDDEKTNGTINSDKKRIKKDILLEKEKKFVRGAGPFILLTVIPYMLQIIVLGNINRYAFACFRDEVHRAVRLNELFDHDSYLVAMSADSAVSPGVYAASIEEIASTSYDLLNRKLFSVPKLLLLPQVIMREPMLLVKIFPLIFFVDFLKGRFVAYLSTEVERLKKEEKDLRALRTKIESFDMKNADLIQRSGLGSTKFTQRRWAEITEQIQEKQIAGELLKRTRGFYGWLQRNYIFASLIDCALANLIAVGRIVSADIFVFSRAIEDAVDLVLMKSRAEAELTSMATEIVRLDELVELWDSSKNRNLTHCDVNDSEDSNGGTMVAIKNLEYSRGTARVSVRSLELTAGVYAITGANGSGKSTLFRVLMSCDSNEKSIDLPESIIMGPKQQCANENNACVMTSEYTDVSNTENDTLSVSIKMPSPKIVEISQTFYWPLYTKPIDWIYQSYLSEIDDTRRKELVDKVVVELQNLLFTQDLSKQTNENGPETMINREVPQKLDKELLEVKEDWFNDLSGGQRSKVELVRKVFLLEKCPEVLLIDETMAPLDPISKSLVMTKIKKFCHESVVLVIYHSDVVAEMATGNANSDDLPKDCVPSSGFFDENLHVENGVLVRRSVC